MVSQGWFSAGSTPAHGMGSREHGRQRCLYGVRSSPVLSLGWASQGRGDMGPSLQPCTHGQHLPPSPVLNAPEQIPDLAHGIPVQLGGTRSWQGSSCTSLWFVAAIPMGRTATKSHWPHERSSPSHGMWEQASQDRGTARARLLGLGTLRSPGTLDGAEPAVTGSSFTLQRRAQCALVGAEAEKFKWDVF